MLGIKQHWLAKVAIIDRKVFVVGDMSHTLDRVIFQQHCYAVYVWR